MAEGDVTGWLTPHEIEKLAEAHRRARDLEAGIAEARRLVALLDAEAAR